MKTVSKKLTVLVCAIVLAFSALGGLAGCSKNSISNEETRLVIGSQELDGVFNPFYSSSASDSEIVGMTQLSMLGSDAQGKVVYGEDEACIVLDMEKTSEGTGEQQITTYKFVLKNGLQFSNGSPLTMKDVLFNLYVYLDPMYYGSATVYSTDIVGLKAYRTQQRSTGSQDRFEDEFIELAEDRMLELMDQIESIQDDADHSLTDEEMRTQLKAADDRNPDMTFVADYDYVKEQVKTYLDTTWTYSIGTAEDIKYKDSNNKDVALTTDTEAFLFNLGFITWDTTSDKNNYHFSYTLGEQSKDWTEEYVKNALYNHFVPNNILSAIARTYDDLLTYFTAKEMEKYFEDLDDRITNIEGIQFANRKTAVTVNGTQYAVPTYNADGSVASGNEVLSIQIHKVDPKAIWSFAFAVAPMYYYSNAEQIGLFDYEDHFGVQYGNRDFMDKVIKDPNKIGVPMGAGPYKATTNTGDSASVTSSSFKSHNVVYFERNDHFMGGNSNFRPKIKYINYQVVSEKLMLESLASGDIHFVTPASTEEKIRKLDSMKNDGFGSIEVRTNGYGYIGINAEKVPNINVRRAIMSAIDTRLCTQYYLGHCTELYRGMPHDSWAYPKSVTDPYYPVLSAEEIKTKYIDPLADEGYGPNSDGVWVSKNGDDILKYTFTIAGDDPDHPAYSALNQAKDKLNSIGFDIEVKTDLNALKKLANGDLTVWAAAWSSTIDPDMYQVYHMDSSAGATKNWGYRAILNPSKRSQYSTEYNIVERLSDLIDKAREIDGEKEEDVQAQRAPIYYQALDLVMDLAVELPAYNRNDLFAYNANIIDESTFQSGNNLSMYQGPLSKIWEISLKESI